MKRLLLITAVFVILMSGAGCEDIINNMDSKKKLSVSESAQALDDLIGIFQVTSATGCIFTFDFITDTTGVTVNVSSGSGCAAINGSGFIPYSFLNEGEGGLTLQLNGCSNGNDAGTSYTGTLTVYLTGSSGVITGFEFTGNVEARGEIQGRVSIDISYTVDLNCVLTWDCWSGSVNGYTINALRDALD